MCQGYPLGAISGLFCLKYFLGILDTPAGLFKNISDCVYFSVSTMEKIKRYQYIYGYYLTVTINCEHQF